MTYARATAVFLTAALCLTASAAELASPSEFLGYELGERFTRHHQVVRYFDHLDDTSPLVRVEPYGETVEHRPLIRAVITSRANHTKLETIRSRIAELQSPGATSRERAKEIAKDTPAILLLSFGVHGDEGSSTEAAMKLAHQLASSAEISALLETLVVVIDPLQNPDGHEQYVQFYQQAAGSKPDKSPDSVEHTPPWRSGRTNEVT